MHIHLDAASMVVVDMDVNLQPLYNASASCLLLSVHPMREKERERGETRRRGESPGERETTLLRTSPEPWRMTRPQNIESPNERVQKLADVANPRNCEATHHVDLPR